MSLKMFNFSHKTKNLQITITEANSRKAEVLLKETVINPKDYKMEIIDDMDIFNDELDDNEEIINEFDEAFNKFYSQNK